MYQVTKEVAVIRQEVTKEIQEEQELEQYYKSKNEENAGSDENVEEVKSFGQLVKERLEQRCEEEKAKSVIVQRCNRIYDSIIKDECEELYVHLIEVNQMSPELQLMRWLKCMLAREFNEQSSLQCWDFILGGMFLCVV